MILSSLIGGGVKPYLEYALVCAPNTAGQSIAANTITTLTIDTEVADTGNYGSIASNQITLAAGTYYFEGNSILWSSAYPLGGTILLYNNSTILTRSGVQQENPIGGGGAMLTFNFKGQTTFTSTATLTLQVFVSSSCSVQNGGSLSTLATAGADQRTTIKLWKLA